MYMNNLLPFPLTTQSVIFANFLIQFHAPKQDYTKQIERLNLWNVPHSKLFHNSLMSQCLKKSERKAVT